jgi:two-component system vancomycin resistance associated response regulator VraR
MKLKIVLLEEYRLALQGLYDHLNIIPEFEIVGAYADIQEVVLCLKSKPVDIVIVNLMSKDVQSLDVLEEIWNMQDHKVKVIALVPDKYNKFIYKRALEMGVRAFLPKDTSYNELISCIQNVGKGNDVIPDFLVKESKQALLSEMETKVLQLIVEEWTNEEIAKALFISRRTVETYVANICKKLEVDGRIGAVREAIKLKLV